METINYQGQSIEAELVNQMNGVLLVAVQPNDFMLSHDMDEKLYRDAGGHYYLARTAQWLDYDGTTQRKASGRTLVHRLSTTAAVLWATVRMEATTYALRHDAREALAAPKNLNTVRQFADGSMAVTLHLKPAPARLFRVACEMNRRDPLAELFAALKCSVVDDVSAWDNREECKTAFDENAPQAVKLLSCDSHLLRLVGGDGTILDELSVGRNLLAAIEERRETCQCRWADAIGNLIERGAGTITDAYRTVQLNDKVVALLERYQRKSGAETTDVVNGAAISLLECALGNDGGPSFEEAIEEANNLRNGITFHEDDEDEEAVILNLTTVGDGTVGTVEMPRSLYDEIERRATTRGQDFATYIVKVISEAVSPDTSQRRNASGALPRRPIIEQDAAALSALVKGVGNVINSAKECGKEANPQMLTLRGNLQTALDNFRAVFGLSNENTFLPDREDDPNAGVEDEDEADDHDFATGRRAAGDPADVALLAAAEPEAVEDLPPEQRGEQPPAPMKGKGKCKRTKDGREGK